MESKRCYGCMQLKQERPVCEHCCYDERVANASHQLPAGTILQGKYLLGKVLGQGGFGITYLGRDIALDIPVAIKEYYPTGVVTRESSYSHRVSLATGAEDTRFAENRSRFLREARTLAKLQDVPEVVQVMSFFEENNTAYIVMGYVKGITLKEHMRRSGGRLSPTEVFRLLEPLMEGMSQVHAHGLVHRDISPDNIMLQPNGQARLIDFGAAHAATAAGDKSTQAVLKHGFAPLEQYQRKADLGPWTDVYAMCATVYHCLTGLIPPNAADRIVGEDEFRWDALTGLTPGQLATLKHGLAPLHKQRIQTMNELCRKLFDKTGEPLQPVPKPERKPLPILVNFPPESPADTGFAAASNKKHGLKIGKLLVAACVLTVIALLLFLFKPKTASIDVPTGGLPIDTTQGAATQPTEATQGTATQPAEPPLPSTTPISDGSRILMVNTEFSSGVFRTGIPRDQIESITLLNATEAPADAVDASQAQDGSVLAWVIPCGEGYALYFAARGSIIAPEDCSYMFCNYTKAKRLDLSGFDTGNVTDMSFMFSECSSLEELNISGFDTGNVTDMGYMFSGCSSLTELDVSGFDTGNVTDMGYMFSDCSDLSKLDVSGFDTGNVTNMVEMFSYCSSLEELDLSAFVTGNVTSMGYMFSYCSSLEELDLSAFVTEKVTDMGYMFWGCSSLEELDVSSFNTRFVRQMHYMFYDTPRLQNVNGNFNVRSAYYFYDFMDPGDTFNGRPWEKLFQ